MPGRIRLLFLVTVLLAAASAPAAAQRVQGTVRDSERGQPIPAARLLLLTEAGAAVDSTVADAAGQFRLAAPSPGSYVVYFSTAGWAGVPSRPIRLADGATAELDFRVQLISNDALKQMGEIMRLEPRLQQRLPELCGEPVRAWEAGLLVGLVRERGTGARVAGAHVAVAGTAGAGVRPTLSSEQGVYLLCNVPAGPAVKVVVTSPRSGADTTVVEVRAGTAGWYDLEVRGRRR